MIPELTDSNVDKLATLFLDVNILLPNAITMTTFVGYAFPTDEDHPEPWGKRAGQLRRAIKKWLDDREDQISEVSSKRGRPTYTWKDPLKIAAIRAKQPVQPKTDLVQYLVTRPGRQRATKEFVKALVQSKLK